jgi:uncharacterized damage-inducible protein DinB
MPEDGYTFKPGKDMWTFGELLHHIAYGIEWWEDNFIKGIKTDWAPPAALKQKQAIADALEKAYDRVAVTVSGLPADKVDAGLHATLDHITHHRGQAVIYLRLNGAVPPEYTY